MFSRRRIHHHNMRAPHPHQRRDYPDVSLAWIPLVFLFMPPPEMREFPGIRFVFDHA